MKVTSVWTNRGKMYVAASQQVKDQWTSILETSRMNQIQIKTSLWAVKAEL